MANACSISPPPPILTNEKFETRINPQGQTEFVYGLSWRHTSRESLLGDRPEPSKETNDRKQTKSQGQRGDRKLSPYERPAQFNIQADNQTKLELEDKAAAGLNKKLIKENLCVKGYDISSVVWKADNIRLVGYCFK
jgi:hypothetical protein